MPVALTFVFIRLESNKYFNLIPYVAKQILYGVSFGILAIIGTEYGIPFNGAQVNARDAAVLAAGLGFGAPAGIIAGLIGGIERYIAVYWGIGTYTRVACTVSTIIAGFYSAALRKYMFNNHRPNWSLSLASGLVMEVFHMTMVFLTNMSDSAHAMQVVQTCSVVMIPANAISTMLSTMAGNFASNEVKKTKQQLSVSQTIQRWMLIFVVGMFAVTCDFMYRLQGAIADEQVESRLTIAVEDLEADILDASDENLLKLAREIANSLDKYDVSELADLYHIAEVSVVGVDGKISQSNIINYISFDMNSGAQSREFLCLLNGETEYVQAYGPTTNNPYIYRKYAGVAIKNGFVQVGYNAEEFQEEIASQVKNAANNKHVGSNGYILVADNNLFVVSAPEEHSYNTIDKYGFDIEAKQGVVNRGIIDGEDCFFKYIRSEGYYLVSVIPVEESYSTRNTAVYVNAFMEIMAFAVLFALIYKLIDKTVVQKIDNVNRSLAKITSGDLNEVVKENSSHEFVLLSSDINATVDKLKQYIDEASARIDAEIEYAKNIQESALPHVFPNNSRYEIYALMEAAKGVGGDFYDFFNTTRHGVNFLIADVSGKGIPGAMFMMRAKSELHSLTETGIEVHDVFTYGNERLCEGNDAGMFVTAWEGCIDTTTGLVKYANAGHNPPVIIRADGTCEYVRGKAGFVLAGMEGIKYKDQELQMYPGDILFLYTDGVVEATNANKELYGEDRLIECLKNVDRTLGMDYLCCEVIGDVGRFVGEAEQFDDITMLAFKYKGDIGEKLETKSYTLDGSQNQD